jgi:hypothetical protein
MRVSPTTVSRSSSIVALLFLDLAQRVGFATILFELVDSLAAAKPKAEEISMTQHVSRTERRSKPSTGPRLPSSTP